MKGWRALTEIKSPVSGAVWQIVVAVGDRVAEGDELIVLESMKMEIPIEAPHAGTVASIGVELGTRVQEGEVVMGLEP